jgi:hypothetical protein
MLVVGIKLEAWRIIGTAVVVRAVLNRQYASKLAGKYPLA